MIDRSRPLTPGGILAFWTPLAATWLMMSVEGPFIAAIIARLADPTFNLAAYGVAFSFAFIAEAPIIMVLTAANALVGDRQSYLALRRFVYALNGAVTAAMIIGLYPPLFRFVTDRLIGLPPEVAHLSHVATALLVLWPAAIGYRRFYQGVLVRHHMPQRVAYGTIVRVVSMSTAAGALHLAVSWPGAWVGSVALAFGVVCEAAASRWMARKVVAEILSGPPSLDAMVNPLTTRQIFRFYYPLALTSVIAIGVSPLVTFFLGRSRSPIESLAVLPVISGLVFLFRSGALAYQEVGVALVGPERQNGPLLTRVAGSLAAAATLSLAGVLFTPLADVWFSSVSGLSPGLTRFALWPARAQALLPAMDYLLTLQRSLLIVSRRTRVITIAAAVEVAFVIGVMVVGVFGLDLVGALVASSAILIGRIAGNLFLLGVARWQGGQ
jgi:hypothetical protein